MESSTDDLRRAVTFLTTPLIIETLLALRNGAAAREDLDRYGSAVNSALEALTNCGAITASPPGAEPVQIQLTARGRHICDLVEQLAIAEDAGRRPLEPAELAPSRVPHCPQ